MSSLSNFSQLWHGLIVYLCFLASVPILSAQESDGTVADNDAPDITSIQVGYQGQFKVGCWTRIELEVLAAPGTELQLVITAADPDGHPVDHMVPKLKVPAAGKTTVTELIRTGRLEAPLRVHQQTPAGLVLLKQIPTNGTVQDATGQFIRSWPQHHQIWLVAGNHPAFEHAAERWNISRPGTLHLLAQEQVSDFGTPLSEGLNGIVLSPDLALNEASSQALATWVHRGGRLVIPVGGQVDLLQASPLASWLPLMPVSQGTTRNLVPLRELVPQSASLKVVTELPAAQFDRSRGTFLAGELVGRAAYGKGGVTILAVPLDQEPLVSWDASSQAELAVKLLDITPPWETVTSTNNTTPNVSAASLNPTGVSDFQSQLVNILDTFPQVQRGSNWTVVGALLALLLLVGPVDYLVVNRWLKRPHWTWVTLPLLVLGFGSFLMRLAGAANQHPVSSQQIEIVDIHAGEGLLRSHTWTTFYSPETARYQLDPELTATGLAASGEFSQPPLLSWQARPEPGFRGMYHGSGMDNRKPRYQVDVRAGRVEQLPVQVWSSAGLECQWEKSGVDIQEFLQPQLSDFGDGRLSGTLKMDLGSEVRDWVLLYRNDAYLPSDRSALMPGEIFAIKEAWSSNQSYVLIGETDIRTNTPDEYRTNDRVPWHRYDPLSQDRDMVVRMMSFHQLMGGTGYSQLHHAAAGETDCSTAIPLNTAILFGRLIQPWTQLKINGAVPEHGRQDTYIRVFLPVDRKPRPSDAPVPDDIRQIGQPGK